MNKLTSGATSNSKPIVTPSPPKKIQSEEAVREVTRTMFGQHDYEDKRIKIRPFVTIPARVRASMGRTIKVGDFEFLRVDVSFESPCYKEEMLDVYKEVLELTKKELGDVIEETLTSLRGGTIDDALKD